MRKDGEKMDFVKTDISQSPIELIPMSCDDCLTGCEDFFEGETVEESQGSNNSAGEKADDAKLSI